MFFSSEVNDFLCIIIAPLLTPLGASKSHCFFPQNTFIIFLCLPRSSGELLWNPKLWISGSVGILAAFSVSMLENSFFHVVHISYITAETTLPVSTTPPALLTFGITLSIQSFDWLYLNNESFSLNWLHMSFALTYRETTTEPWSQHSYQVSVVAN